MSNGREFPNGAVGSWLRLLVSAALIPILGYLLWSNAQVTGNRFTSQDGLEVWKEIGEIRKEMAALPPDSFEDKVEDLVRTVADLKTEVALLKQAIEDR